MRARTNQRQGGFTLIEVMVAILLMAVVSVIAWRGLDSVSRADSHLQASSEQTEELLRTLHQLERDVALRASVELMEPVPAGADAEAVDVPAALTVRSADSGTFRLDVIRSSATPGEGLQRVRWWLKGDTLYRGGAGPRSLSAARAEKRRGGAGACQRLAAAGLGPGQGLAPAQRQPQGKPARPGDPPGAADAPGRGALPPGAGTVGMITASSWTPHL